MLSPLGQHAGFFFYCTKPRQTHAVISWAYKNVTLALYFNYGRLTEVEEPKPDPAFVFQPRELLTTVRAQQARVRKLIG